MRGEEGAFVASLGGVLTGTRFSPSDAEGGHEDEGNPIRFKVQTMASKVTACGDELETRDETSD